jgi:hypothetical protein
MENIIIEKAKKTDAAEIVRLISLADKDAVLALSGKDDINDALHQYEINFNRDDIYFSYKNIFVARNNRGILGCILYFRGEDESGFQSITESLPEMENESDPDEIYIDSLAVLPECRGKGIAKRLVNQVTLEARKQGFQKVGLLADKSKPYLGRMYQTLGFNVTAEVNLLNDHYEKMTFYTEPPLE